MRSSLHRSVMHADYISSYVIGRGLMATVAVIAVIHAFGVIATSASGLSSFTMMIYATGVLYAILAGMTVTSMADDLGQGYASLYLAHPLSRAEYFAAWMISGPEGIGKATLAYRFARFVFAGGGGRPREGSETGQGLFGDGLGLDDPEEKADSLYISPKHPVFCRVASGGHVDLKAVVCTVNEKTGERRTETEWFNVVAWGSLAEICNQLLRKGTQVYIEGRLHTRRWEDENGVRHYRTEIVANEMVVLGDRNHNHQPTESEPGTETEAESQDFPESVDEDEFPF